MGKTTLQWAVTAVTAVTATAGVVSCSDEPSKGDITRALNASLGQQAVCFAPEDMSKPETWPLRLNDMNGIEPLPVVLLDMAKAGYVRIEHARSPQGSLFANTVAVITPTEQAKAWWDPKQGWCVGKGAVADVQEWTLPGKEAGQPMQVQFTWHLVDVPAWARRPEFDDIPGMKEPVPSVTTVARTSNGWVAQ